jgi:hypothetical protein
MPWIKLISPTGRLQFFNPANLIVFRGTSGLEAAGGARTQLWMQSGKAQVRETPAAILKLLAPGWIKLTTASDTPIYFNPDSCTEISELFDEEKTKDNRSAKTKVRTENEDFDVTESVERVFELFGAPKVA